MRKSVFFHLLKANVASSMALKASFALRLIMMSINNLVYFVVWYLIFTKVEYIGNHTFHDVAYFFGVSATSFGVCYSLFSGFTKIPQFVRSGALDVFLMRPKPVLSQVLTAHCEPSGWGDVISGIYLIWLSGYLTLVNVPGILFGIVTGALVHVFVGVTILP